jgi:excisionase family DNA binding protein
VSPVDALAPFVDAITEAVLARLPQQKPVRNLPTFLTYAEAGRELRVHARTVEKMANQGKVKRVYLDGSMPRIPRSELDRLEGR